MCIILQHYLELMQNFIDSQQLIDLIDNYIDPCVGKTWKDLKVTYQVEQLNNHPHLKITLPYPALGIQDSLIADITQRLKALGLAQPEITIGCHIDARVTQPGIDRIPDVKNIIAVGSGKGGVGKSTTTVNLALALMLEGAKVGILDADIYGPNQPQMLGVQGQLEHESGQSLTPVSVHGVQSISMGYLVDMSMPIIWRGPMVSSALQQLARSTLWDNLDYLLIDLPPGTGDIQLTLSQKIPVTAALIVTTPQDVALLDARKGLAMFQKVNVPILGIIENMSTYVCSHCGQEDAIFGFEGAHRLAQESETELLGQLPLLRQIREQADSGQPIVIADPGNPASQLYRAIARKVAAKLALQPRSFMSKFPKVVVE